MFVVPDEAPRFEFQVGEDAYSMPQVNDLPLGDALRIKAAVDAAGPEGRADALSKAAVDLFEAYAPGVVERLTVSQFTALVNAYMGNGEAMGESSGSSD